MKLDRVLRQTYGDFRLPVSQIVMHPGPARAFCNTVQRRLKKVEIPIEVLLKRLMDLDDRGELDDED